MIKKKAKKPWPRLRITDNYKQEHYVKRNKHPDSGIQTIIDNDYFEIRDLDFNDDDEEYSNV